MSDTTELPSSVERCRRFVKGCRDSGEGTVLWVGDGVGIVLHDVGPGDAVFHAVGHRLPVHRRISTGAALGLVRLGVPTETPLAGIGSRRVLSRT